MSPSHSEPIYLGRDLNLDLWFRGNLDRAQSVLIRATDTQGFTHTSFLHLDGRVEQIPVFHDGDPLSITTKKQKAVREFTWSPDVKKKSLIPFVARITSTSLILVLLAFLLTGLLQIRIVLTGSMKPAINPGDMVFAASSKVIDPEVGKVVLYSVRDLQGNPVTIWAHRIVSGNKVDGFTIKGDANTQPDIGTISLEDIKSVVVFRIPYVGHIFNVYSLVLICAGVFLTSVAYSQRKQLE